MTRKQVGTRLPDDDVQTLERYCSERDISKAEALRRSVRKLGEDKDEQTVEPDWAWRSIVLSMGTLIALSETGFMNGTATVLGGTVLIASYVAWYLYRHHPGLDRSRLTQFRWGT